MREVMTPEEIGIEVAAAAVAETANRLADAGVLAPDRLLAVMLGWIVGKSMRVGDCAELSASLRELADRADEWAADPANLDRYRERAGHA